MDKNRKELIEKFQKWLDTKPRKQIIAAQCATIAEEYHKEQLRLYGVSITLPNIDEINKVLKKQIEHLEYTEKLDGYEMVAYKRGFTYCLKWLGNKLTKGNYESIS